MQRQLAISYPSISIWGIVYLAFSVACTDASSPIAVTSERKPLVVPQSPSADVSYDPVTGGTISLGLTSNADPSITATIPGFAKKTLLRVTITGSVSTSLTQYNDGGPNQPQEPGAPRTFGPAGYFYSGTPPNIGCAAQVTVGYGSWGGGTLYSMPCTSSRSTDGSSQAQGFVYAPGSYVTGTATRSGGNPNLGQCFTYASGTFSGYGPCFSYNTSNQTVVLEKVHADFDVTVVPSTVNYGDTVTVTATISPSDVSGKPVPWSVDNTIWVPAFGTQNQPCGSGNFLPTIGDVPNRVCRAIVTRSGQLTVFGTVNGNMVSKVVAITVNPPKIKLTASPTVVRTASSVTFTATVTPTVSWNVSSWSWIPDGGGTGGIAPNSCGWTENPCTRTISKTGRMIVTANIGEYALADTVRVWYVPCITGDSTVDQPKVRDDFITQQTLSKQEQLERGGIIFRNLSTGADSIVWLPNLPRGGCYVDWNIQLPHIAGYATVAFWHTHWKQPGATCTAVDGSTYTAGKGLSIGDWWASRRLNCPLYTIDDKHIWRINPWTDNKMQFIQRPQREVERNSNTTHCPAMWPALTTGEEVPPYECL